MNRMKRPLATVLAGALYLGGMAVSAPAVAQGSEWSSRVRQDGTHRARAALGPVTG